MSEKATISRSTQHDQSTSFSIQWTPKSRIDGVDLDHPGFGEVFSDHMLSISYGDGQWVQPEIIPFGNLSLSPATAALHYGQMVFEGMKAFRGTNGQVRIFRMHDHLNRLAKSCARMCIPTPDIETLGQALKTLVEVDRKWVPSKHGNALYIRPLILATDRSLGVKPAQSYRLLIMTSPVGAYYEEGFDPVSLTTDTNFIRAAKGGSGTAKTACNYGPTLLPARTARENGFTQIIWLDAREQKFIEEVGTMNIFFKIDGELHTPKLSGSILPGITRKSVIKLAEKNGTNVHRRPISIDEVFEADRNNTLDEIFGTGTAAVVSPVGSIHHSGNTLITDKEEIGPFARQMFNTITGIQYGNEEDTFNWMENVS